MNCEARPPRKLGAHTKNMLISEHNDGNEKWLSEFVAGRKGLGDQMLGFGVGFRFGFKVQAWVGFPFGLELG